MKLKQRILRKIYEHLPNVTLEKLINIRSKSLHYPIVFMFHHIIPETNIESYGKKYHSDTPNYDVKPFSVSPEKFEEILLTLKEYNYTFLFEEEYNLTREKSVIITFDDGYTDNYLYAYPILKKHRIKASINIIAEKITDFDDQEFVTRGRIKEMRKSGLVQFQAHTMSHRILTQCSEEELYKEIVDCRNVIFEKTGIDCTVFVYPCCRADKRVYELVKPHYSLAYGGESTDGDYLYRIPRIEIDMSYDKHKLLSNMLFSFDWSK